MKRRTVWGIGIIAIFGLLAFSPLISGPIANVFAQATEVCNGIDDNNNGVIDEDVNCDHYLSYLIDENINPLAVILKDQFIGPTNFGLVHMERILNPVRKKHGEMIFNPKRPDLHYLAYRLQSLTSFTPRSVMIENQFEKNTIEVTKPHYLLAPAGKKKIGFSIERLSNTPVADRLSARFVPPIPQDANHYLCYDIKPYAVSAHVWLRDQFQAKQFDVIRARYLCNPAEKVHQERVSPIVDPEDHFMCYEVIPHNAVKRRVVTHDQFGIKSIKTVRTEEICVPTKKTLMPTTCTRPDNQGTVVMLDPETKYQNTGGQLVIIQPALITTGLTADATLMGNSSTVITRTGTPATGETYTFDTEILQMSLSGGGRVLNIPVQGEIHTSPRTPGDPIQSFDTDMHQLQGQLPPGDPDFDLLRITAGTGFGLPSPGHTTLTQLPGDNWNVDSFFDITYRIDFVGAPGGPYAGQSGSTTGTIRMANLCPR